jgi:hypothetical protein
MQTQFGHMNPLGHWSGSRGSELGNQFGRMTTSLIRFYRFARVPFRPGKSLLSSVSPSDGKKGAQRAHEPELSSLIYVIRFCKNRELGRLTHELRAWIDELKRWSVHTKTDTSARIPDRSVTSADQKRHSLLKTGTAAALLPRFATTFFGGITTARMAMTDEANSGVPITVSSKLDDEGAQEQGLPPSPQALGGEPQMSRR